MKNIFSLLLIFIFGTLQAQITTRLNPELARKYHIKKVSATLYSKDTDYKRSTLWVFEFDTLGRCIKRKGIHENGEVKSVQIHINTYDKQNNLIEEVSIYVDDPKNDEYVLIFGEARNDTIISQYIYHSNNKLQKKIRVTASKDTVITEYAYKDLRLVQSKTYTNSDSYYLQFDMNTTNYFYDNLGRLIKEEKIAKYSEIREYTYLNDTENITEVKIMPTPSKDKREQEDSLNKSQKSKNFYFLASPIIHLRFECKTQYSYNHDLLASKQYFVKSTVSNENILKYMYQYMYDIRGLLREQKIISDNQSESIYKFEYESR